MKNLIFIFVDGFGLGPPHAANPFTRFPMAHFKALTRTEFFLHPNPSSLPNLLLKPIDAGLGVSGAGQSGTGQFSIYTGINGAKKFGRHFGPHIPSSLKQSLGECNPFKKLKEIGLKPHYINAYPKIFIETCLKLRKEGKIRSSVLFEAAAMEDISFCSVPELKAGLAISGDITGAWWKKNLEHGDPTVKEILPEDAARNLHRIAQNGTAALFEFFLPDLSGHGRVKLPPQEIIARLDRFLSELLNLIDTSLTMLVLTSDHGNFEDDSTEQHTLNPVPLLVYGVGSELFEEIESIHQIFPKVIMWLSEGK